MYIAGTACLIILFEKIAKLTRDKMCRKCVQSGQQALKQEKYNSVILPPEKK